MEHHGCPYIAVFDFGTSSGRCLLIDQRGTVLASSQIDWNYEQRNWEGLTLWSFDPGQYWSNLAACCQKALSAGNISTNEAIGVIATSQRHGGVLIDSKGRAIEAIPNNDMRSTPEWDEKANENAHQIYKITCRWPRAFFFYLLTLIGFGHICRGSMPKLGIS